MGTPRKQRKAYSRPKAPYNMERIVEEKELCAKYGLKNKKELWRANSELIRTRTQAKKLLALSGDEADKELNELIGRLNSIGINVSGIDDILTLQVSDLLDRRLQSLVCSRGLSSTMKQARQYINHNHVMVGSHRVTVPGYLVKASEEDMIRLVEEFAKKLTPVAKTVEEVTSATIKDEGEEKPPEKEKKPKSEKKEEEPKSEKKAEEKPVEEPKAEEKPAEKPAEEKAEDKPVEEPKAEEKPAEEPKAEEKPAEKPAEEKAEDKPVEEPKAEEKPAEKPAEEKAEDKPAEEKPADGGDSQ